MLYKFGIEEVEASCALTNKKLIDRIATQILELNKISLYKKVTEDNGYGYFFEYEGNNNLILCMQTNITSNTDRVRFRVCYAYKSVVDTYNTDFITSVNSNFYCEYSSRVLVHELYYYIYINKNNDFIGFRGIVQDNGSIPEFNHSEAARTAYLRMESEKEECGIFALNNYNNATIINWLEYGEKTLGGGSSAATYWFAGGSSTLAVKNAVSNKILILPLMKRAAGTEDRFEDFIKDDIVYAAVGPENIGYILELASNEKLTFLMGSINDGYGIWVKEPV